MKYEIVSDYIFDIGEPLEANITIKTTPKVKKILTKIAKDNEMTTSMIVNNAILLYLIRDIERKKGKNNEQMENYPGTIRRGNRKRA